jgi:hypothetical protein
MYFLWSVQFMRESNETVGWWAQQRERINDSGTLGGR